MSVPTYVRQTDGRTDGRTDGLTDGRTDVHMYVRRCLTIPAVRCLATATPTSMRSDEIEEIMKTYLKEISNTFLLFFRKSTLPKR